MDYYEVNCDQELYQMLRRIAKQFPLNRLANPPVYLFSTPQNEPQQKRNKSFKSSFFEKTMVKYILVLEKATSHLKNSGEVSSAFKTFNHFTKKEKMGTSQKQPESKQKEPGEKEQKTSDEQPQVIPPSFETMIKNALKSLVVVTILSGFLFSQSKQSLNQRLVRSSTIIHQNEMINLLSAGLMSPEVVILREFKDKRRSNSKSSYQTICVAKESNRTSATKMCIVNNLENFLARVEKINLPYNLSFHYNADEPKQPFQLPLGTLLTILLFYVGYRFVKSNPSLRDEIDKGLNLKKYEPTKPELIKTHFKDVAGMHEAKQQITQFVDFLKNPDKYIEMGAKIPKGALLTGPPGTGKTLLARACAGEAGVPFFYVSGSEFVEKYVGLGANRVRSLFQSAAKAAPSIIFIDQIDAIGKKRSSGPFSNEQKENTLNQLLVNMDGFDTKNKIIVMAATNLKQSLDPALLRPGRFDRSIEINLPNFEERIEILKVHLAKVTFTKKFTIDEMAKKISVLTPGFSGAELANICNEAAILAARDNKKSIQLPQFQKATERVMAGLQKRNLFTDEQKQCLAYYECGKAVVAWFSQGADPVIKISIAPYSKSSTGYSHQIKDQMPLKTKAELLNKAICYLSGRMAEQYFKGYTTNNGEKDLKKAKRVLTLMVSKFGMSNVIGRIGYPDIQYVRKPYSNEVESKIDQEVKKLFGQCQAKAKQLITQKVELIEKLKKLILQKQTLTHTTLKQVLGERPFEDNQNYQKFLKDNQETKSKEEATLAPPAQ